jgi:hypothetical protein
VEFCDEAKRNSVGYDHLKRLVHYMDGKRMGLSIQWTQFDEDRLKRENIPVHNITKGQGVPKESLMVTDVQETFAQIGITRHL